MSHPSTAVRPFQAAVLLSLIFVNSGPAHADAETAQTLTIHLKFQAAGDNSLPSERSGTPPPVRENAFFYSPPPPQRGDFEVQLPAPDMAHPTVQAVASALRNGVQISRRTGASSVEILYTARQGQQFGLVGQVGDWYCVLMADNSVGCVPRGSVRVDWSGPGLSLSANVSSTSVQQHPFPEVLFPAAEREAASYLNRSGNKVVQDAMKYLGVRYRWGGNDEAGIDCSGLVEQVFLRHGITLPRTAREQAKVGIPIRSVDEAQPGDRLSFCCHARTVDHTGIYIGNGQFIHAAGGRGEVCIGKLDGFYLRSLTGIHRDDL